MALRNPSLFLYDFEITIANQFITFVNSSGTLTATVALGYYSLNGLGLAIISAIQAQDVVSTYSFSVNRAILGGTENRFTLTSTDTVFSLLFSSGNPNNPASLIGFGAADFTGATTYTGSSTCGTALIPNQLGYTYLSPKRMPKNLGAVNVSASGLKESITFSVQTFWQVMFKYIPEALADSDWYPLMIWLIQQREFEFTPDITDPNTVFVSTLENPGTGIELPLTEMLPDFPFLYSTPLMNFRQTPNT